MFLKLTTVGRRYKIFQGTNLICDFGSLILKIFAPASCGYQAATDFNRELYALQQLQKTELRVPYIVGGDCIHDRYDLYFLILERLEIPPVAQLVDVYTPRELSRFGGKILNSIDIFKEIIVNRDVARVNAFFPYIDPGGTSQMILLSRIQISVCMETIRKMCLLHKCNVHLPEEDSH